MREYVIRRLLLSILVLWLVSTLAFSLMRLLPGDPVAVMLQSSGGSAARIEQLRHQLGLDQPIHVQYGLFLSGLIKGDLGKSIFTGRPVFDVILEQLPSTIELALSALFIGTVSGIALGVLSAIKEGSWLDQFFMLIAIAGISMPSFWLGLLMIYLFSLTLGWLPATGQGGIERLIMPACVLGFNVGATAARLARSSMVEVMREDYIRTARSKGLQELGVVVKHALRNALIPVVTMMGLEFGWLLGGAVVTETVFTRQGLGRLTIQAVLWKDFPLVQGAVVVAATFYMAANLLVDLLYVFIDPRIGAQR